MIASASPALSSQSMADLLCTIIILCRGKQASGRPYWAYMCIKPSMARAFKEAREKGSFELGQFGSVIEWGEGNDVPADVQERMARDYGVSHDYEDQLARAIESLPH